MAVEEEEEDEDEEDEEDRVVMSSSVAAGVGFPSVVVAIVVGWFVGALRCLDRVFPELEEEGGAVACC